MRLWTNDYKVCKADVILEQLEERIVLDSAVEASAGVWDGPDPGNGIWDGGFHVIEGTPFAFLEGAGGGLGVGYWWSADISAWGWAFDYKSEGREFESLRAHQKILKIPPSWPWPARRSFVSG